MRSFATIVEELRSLDLRVARDAEIRRLLRELFGQSAITNTLKALANTPLFRARRHSRSEFFRNLSDLGTPPVALTKLGRANEAGRPVLYVSESAGSALQEVHLNAGDTASVLEYRVRPSHELDVQHLGLGSLMTPALSPVLREIERRTAQLEVVMPDLIQRSRRLLAFLEHEFTKIVEPGAEHQYKITAAIARMLAGDTAFDGIAYPGIATNKRAVNLALNPRAAETKLKPVRVSVLRVARTGTEIVAVHVGDAVNFTAAGGITYREATEPISWGTAATASAEQDSGSGIPK